MLPYLMLSLHMLTMREAPAGTQLHIRLTSTVGSYASRTGDPVEAVLIAPVRVNDETLLPAGTTLLGKVTGVKKVGYGILHETATLRLDFQEATLPDGVTVPVVTLLQQVDNGRESVSRNGSIRGVRATNSVAYRVSGYIRTALTYEMHAKIALWAIKTLVVQVPEPEIYYPAGVELTLALTEPLYLKISDFERAARHLNNDERADLEPVVHTMTYRTHAQSNQPADLVNLMFIGSHEQIAAAFQAAGWIEAHPRTLWTSIRGIQAVAENRGYLAAPMTSLLLNNTTARMSWQKGFNDLAKRDHVRIWKQDSTVDGQEVWIAAATRDIGLAYLRPGQTFTHKIEADVDQERDKIVHDMLFTSCVEAEDLWDRDNVPRVAWNATGDPMYTDGRLAVLRMNGCEEPRTTTPSIESASVPAHGNRFKRFIRRQILSARSDLLRDNVYYRGYEGARWAVTTIRKHRQLSEAAALRRAELTTLP